MAAREELNTFNEISFINRRNGEGFPVRKMKNRLYYPSYRPRYSISIIPCQPKPRRPLASYMGRLSQPSKLYNRIFAEVHDPSGLCTSCVHKSASFINQRTCEEFSEKSSLPKFRKRCLLPEIEQAIKEFVCLLPMSFLSRTIAGVIVGGIIVGTMFYS